MTLDKLQQVTFNNGEQIVDNDLNLMQRHIQSLVMEGLVAMMGTNNANCSTFTNGSASSEAPEGGEDVSSAAPIGFAFTLNPGKGWWFPSGTARKLEFNGNSMGSIIQFVGDGWPFRTDSSWTVDNPSALMFVFEDEYNGILDFTTAVGDGSNPRIDFIEVKLEVITSNALRSFKVDAVKAEKDLNPLTANCETIIRAKNPGASGNSITIQFIADGTGVGSLTESGNAVVFHFQSGVTTVANFESAVAGSSLIEVKTSDGVGTLSSPSDVFSATALAGGVNTIIVGQSVAKNRRVQATFQLKQGTPAATPTYPTPSTGFVPLFAVYVPTSHNAVHTKANLRDMRMPLGGLRSYDTHAKEMLLSGPGAGTTWLFDETKNRITPNTTTGVAYALCPSARPTSRLVGIGICGNNQSEAITMTLGVLVPGLSANTFTAIADLSSTGLGNNIGNALASGLGYAGIGVEGLMKDISITALYPGTKSGQFLGTPLWGNGKPCGINYNPLSLNASYIADSDGGANTGVPVLAVKFSGSTSTTDNHNIRMVRWIFAEGMM